MKKSYLMIAAAAALFAACAENYALKDTNDTEGPVIGFNSYTQKATRSENSRTAYGLDLNDHHETFRVWGFKNTTAIPVFDGEQVSWNTAVADAWSYTNNRYWDKAATTYEFYAYAPATEGVFDFNGVSTTSNQNAGYLTISAGYNKAGENKSPMNSSDALVSMKGIGTNVDLMIADTCSLTGAALTAAVNGSVNLNFIHILSRLNITVKTTDDFCPTKVGGDSIIVDSIIIGHMQKSGAFTEGARSDRQLADSTSGTYRHWTCTGDTAYVYPINYNATQTAKYVVEALILPQNTEQETVALDGTGDITKPYLYIRYHIWNHAGDKGELFEAYYNLAKVFDNDGNETPDALPFNEGWQNTLNITIAPTTIKFDAKVAPWDEKSNEGLTVY